MGIFVLASAADLLFFPGISVREQKPNKTLLLSLGLKDPSGRSRGLTKPCVRLTFCLDVCREGNSVSLELKQPKYYLNICVCWRRGELCPSFQACFEFLGFISTRSKGAGRFLCFIQELILSRYLRAPLSLRAFPFPGVLCPWDNQGWIQREFPCWKSSDCV